MQYYKFEPHSIAYFVKVVFILFRGSTSYFPSHIKIDLYYAGFKAYLVGGCVRDLLLNRKPKDYDIITTAKLKQVLNDSFVDILYF